MKRIAINGFGRIGRNVMRQLLNKKDVEVVAINDLVKADMLAHLFEFDSVYGRVPNADITSSEKSMTVNGKSVQIFAESDPRNLPWKDLNIDLVLECTGRFVDAEKAHYHIEAGAKKVLISAPAPGAVKNIVVGVNDSVINADDQILSGASCTTNCLAPMMHVLNSHFSIKSGFIATTHAYTGDQRLMDSPHKDFRRARAAALNVIPTSTGAAKAIGKVIPSLAGKLDGNALRVPVPSGSLTEATILIEEQTTAEEVNALMEKYANDSLKGILEFSMKPLVSSDILGNHHSCIFDGQLTKVNQNLIRIFGWYDNEVGYSARMVDLINKMNS